MNWNELKELAEIPDFASLTSFEKKIIAEAIRSVRKRIRTGVEPKPILVEHARIDIRQVANALHLIGLNITVRQAPKTPTATKDDGFAEFCDQELIDEFNSIFGGLPEQ